MRIWSYDHMNIRYPIGDGYIQGSRLVVVVVVPRDHMRIWSYADTRGTSMGFLTSKAAPLCPDSVGDACAYDHMIIWTSDWWLVIGRVLYHVIICAYEHPQPFFGVSWRVVKKFKSKFCTRRCMIDRRVGICSSSTSAGRAGSFSTVTVRMGVWVHRPSPKMAQTN